uniref:Uncharacterized protein n=1 Tax=Arundo donax TaxID=35708 RepID=A0A0A9BFB2_ARUDO
MLKQSILDRMTSSIKHVGSREKKSLLIVSVAT